MRKTYTRQSLVQKFWRLCKITCCFGTCKICFLSKEVIAIFNPPWCSNIVFTSTNHSSGPFQKVAFWLLYPVWQRLVVGCTWVACVVYWEDLALVASCYRKMKMVLFWEPCFKAMFFLLFCTFQPHYIAAGVNDSLFKWMWVRGFGIVKCETERTDLSKASILTDVTSLLLEKLCMILTVTARWRNYSFFISCTVKFRMNSSLINSFFYTDEGILFGFGDNKSAQLGQGHQKAVVTKPVQVKGKRDRYM